MRTICKVNNALNTAQTILPIGDIEEITDFFQMNLGINLWNWIMESSRTQNLISDRSQMQR